MSVRFFNLITILLSLAAPSVRADEPLIFPPDHPVDCLHIKLELNVDLAKKFVKARATLDVVARQGVSNIRLDAVDFDVAALTLGVGDKAAKPARFVNDGKSLVITCEPALKPGETARIAIDYSLDRPESGLHFFAPSEAEPEAPLSMWSQGEALENRHWVPCFDEPSERQTTEMIVTAAAGNEVVSNGKLLKRSEDKAGGTVTFHWSQDKPHPAYLMTLVVGPMAMVEETWRNKPVRFYCQPKYKEWLAGSFARTRDMLGFFSEKIGVEYPWDQYAQVSCYGFGGGMENTSATTLGERALYDERSLLDGDPDGLIAHEMAHQWWGDLLTCRDWAHLWLNEGFASYFDCLWTERQYGGDEFAYEMYRNAQSAVRGGKEKPIVDRRYGNPDTQFDARAYPKGAWVLHMLRRRVGDEAYWKSLNLYATRHANQSVETSDLRRAFEDTTGLGLERFFHDWTERPGHPVLDVRTEWNADEKRVVVRVRQTQKEEAFAFPLALEFRVPGGSPVIIRRTISEKDERIEATLSAAPGMVRIDPENALLCELSETKGRDLWMAQLTDDPNPVGRIRAARHFGDSKNARDAALLAAAMRKEKFWGVQREIAEALGGIGGDTARDAMIEGAKHAHPKTRRACVDQLAAFRGDEKAIAAVRPLVVKGDPSYLVEAAAFEAFGQLQPKDGLAIITPLIERRSRFDVLSSAALSGIGHLRNPAAIDLLIGWTKRGKPTQCRAAAVEALGEIVRDGMVDDAATRKVVDALAACLPNEGRWVQRAAVRTLESLGGAAKPALGALEALKVVESSRRFNQDSVQRAMERIRKGAPLDVQLTEMRDRLKKLSDENDELRERLNMLEGKSRPTAKAPAKETKSETPPRTTRSRRR